jgi:hypothetical protein
VHWSATRKPSGTGSECAGHSLKKALCERRTIVFIDESGLSERPPRVRTWAPRGPTPVLQYHFNWKVLSVIAGSTWWNFYFQLYQTTICAPPVVDFLTHLLRHWPGRLLVIWDRSKTHRSHLVAEFVADQRGRLALDWPMPRNSILWNTSGAIGNITSCLTSARMTSVSSAITLDTRCDGCAAGPCW